MTIAASLPLTKRHESPILLYLQRQKGVLSRRLWLFSEQVFRNPKFKERVLGKQEKVPGTGMRRERRFSYSQQEEPRAKGSGNPECRRRRGRPPRPADRALRCLRDAPRVSVPRPQLQGKTFQPRGGSEGNSASFRPIRVLSCLEKCNRTEHSHRSPLEALGIRSERCRGHRPVPTKGCGGRLGGARRKRGRGPNASFSASNSETLSHRQFSQQSQVRAIGLLQRKITFWTEPLVASDQSHCSAPTFLHLSHFPNYSSLPTRLWGIKDRSKSLRGNVNNKNSSFNESDLIWTCVCLCVRL